MGKRTFGQITKLPSGRFRARYTGPDTRLHNAPVTFTTKQDAETWLVDERRLISSGQWTSPADREQLRWATKETFREYAATWLANRRVKKGPIKARTRAHYERLLELRILPTFGDLPMDKITEPMVRRWFQDMEAMNTPTMTAHAYSLMHSIMASATKSLGGPPLIEYNPCQVEGGQFAETKHETKIATETELETIIQNMAPRHRLAIALMGWCGLRFGECMALERGDIDQQAKVVKITKGVVLVNRERRLDTPKDRERRDVHYPEFLDAMITKHLEKYAQPGPHGKLFPASDGGYLSQSTLTGRAARRRMIKGRMVNESATGFKAACEAAGRPDLRLHDLRHTNLTWTAQEGSFADVMQRGGHSTEKAALRYVHAAQEREQMVAQALDKRHRLASSPTTPPEAPREALNATASPGAGERTARILEAVNAEALPATVTALDPDKVLAALPFLSPETSARVVPLLV